jgi:hypothetical protein
LGEDSINQAIRPSRSSPSLSSMLEIEVRREEDVEREEKTVFSRIGRMSSLRLYEREVEIAVMFDDCVRTWAMRRDGMRSRRALLSSKLGSCSS